VHVDAINTFGEFAARVTLFRVVSRRQIPRFRSSRWFMRLVRFPAAPPRRYWSEPQALASFRFSPHLSVPVMYSSCGALGAYSLLAATGTLRFCHDGEASTRQAIHRGGFGSVIELATANRRSVGRTRAQFAGHCRSWMLRV
jgi:hypothetical protein